MNKSIFAAALIWCFSLYAQVNAHTEVISLESFTGFGFAEYPLDQTVPPDSSIKFSARAVDKTGGAVQYRWQANTSPRQIDSGEFFVLKTPALAHACDTGKITVTLTALSPRRQISHTFTLTVAEPYCYIAQGPPSLDITRISMSRDGRLIVGTAKGLGIYDGQHWDNFSNTEPGPKRAINAVTALAVGNDNVVWMGKAYGLGQGVERYNINKDFWLDQRLSTQGNQIAGNYITQIIFDKDGDAILASAKDLSGTQGVTLWLGNQGGSPRLLTDYSVFAMFRDPFDYVWYGTGTSYSHDASGGIFVYKGSRLQYQFDGSQWGGMGITRATDNRDIRALVRDYDNNVWIGLYAGGLERGGLVRYKEDLSRFRGIFSKTPQSIPLSQNIQTLAVDSQNNLWIGTPNGLVLRPYDNDDTKQWPTFTKTSHPQLLKGNNIRDLYFDDTTNFLWIATDKGLSRLAVPHI